MKVNISNSFRSIVVLFVCVGCSALEQRFEPRRPQPTYSGQRFEPTRPGKSPAATRHEPRRPNQARPYEQPVQVSYSEFLENGRYVPRRPYGGRVETQYPTVINRWLEAPNETAKICY